MGGDIGARFQLPAVAIEVAEDVSAVLEAVHDIGEGGGVAQAERVPAFVQAGEIDDALAEEGITAGGFADFVAERVHIGEDEDLRAGASIDQQGFGFAVEVHGAGSPADADAGVFGGREFVRGEQRLRFARPGFESPAGEFGIGALATGDSRGFGGAGLNPEGVWIRGAGQTGENSGPHEVSRDHQGIIVFGQDGYNRTRCFEKF